MVINLQSSAANRCGKKHLPVAGGDSVTGNVIGKFRCNLRLSYCCVVFFFFEMDLLFIPELTSTLSC